MKKNESLQVCIYAGLKKKWLFAMKNFILLMFVFSFQMNANVLSQQKLSLKLKRVSGKELIKAIEKQTKLGFIYNLDEIAKLDGLSIDAEDKSVEGILDEVLLNSGLGFEIEKGIIVIKPDPNNYEIIEHVVQQKIKITGSVKDSKGEPIPFANVVIKGTSIGVVANYNGEFQLEFDEQDNPIIVFSSVGYKTIEVQQAGRSTIDIVLEEDVVGLDEVVVTGYTQQKKETYTGSSITVKKENLKKSSMDVSLMKSLQGQAAGVLVMDKVGDPGKEPEISVRGTGSISANSAPLIIMDGVVITNSNMINPNDVESITVQKDATATAIYGSRGSNGVIIITTKKGMPGKPSVSYDFRQGYGMTVNKANDMMNANQKLDYELALGLRTQTEIDDLKAKGNNTDWWAEMYEISKRQIHDLRVSGGTEASRYAISLGYHNEETVYTSKFDKLNGRLNLDSKLSDQLSVGVNVMFSRSVHDDRREGNADELAVMANPYETGVDDEGNLLPQISNMDNVKYLQKYKESTTVSNAFNTLAYASYRIIPELVFSSKWGVSYSANDGKKFEDPKLAKSWIKPDQRGSLTNSFSKSQTITGTQTLNFSKAIESTHYIKVLLGLETISSKSSGFYATGNGFSSGKVKSLDAAANAKYVSGTGDHSGMLSYFSQFSYAYKEKYFTDLSVRRDGSSKFGDNNKYATFWSVGGGWNLHKEDFLTTSWIDRLKLKASVGTSGNARIGAFQAKMLFASNADYAGSPGIYPDRLENKNLTWEKNFNIGGGFDFSFFKGKINGSIDYYKRTTKDLLLAVNPLGTSGFAGVQGSSSYMENIGKMVNEGVDVSLGSNVINKEDLSLSLRLNLSYNKNEVVELYEGLDKLYGAAIIKEGSPINSLYLADWQGVDPNTGKNMYLDKDGKLTEDASFKKVMENTSPPIYGGFITDFRYKEFGVYALFSFAHGKYTLNNTRFELYNNPTKNQSEDVLNAWKKAGDNSDIAFRSKDSKVKDALYSSQFMEESSFIRLKTVNVSYNLPKQLVNKLKLGGAQVYIQGQNLWTLTKLEYADPETAGTSVGFFPNVKTVLFGFNINF